MVLFFIFCFELMHLHNLLYRFFFNLLILMNYFGSAVIVILFNPYVGPSPRTKIIFFYHQHAQKNYYQIQK